MAGKYEPAVDNLVMVAKSLTARQKSVLYWISQGCEGDPPVANFKSSARMLEGYHLVKIKGRGDAWTATITERGGRVLAGKEWLVPKKKRGEKSAPLPRPATPVTAPPAPPTPPKDYTDEARAVLQKIEDSELKFFLWRGPLSELNEHWIPLSKTAVKLVKERGDNTALEVETEEPGWGRSRAEIKLSLIRLTPMKTAGWREMIRGEKRVARYHPAVNDAFEWRKEKLSPPVYARAKRALHVLFTEVEARGGSVEVKSHYNSWAKKTLFDSVEVVWDGRGHRIKLRELYDRVQRPPTEQEIEDHKRWYSGPLTRKFWDHFPNGLLELEVDYGGMMKDTKRDPNRLEVGMENYFRKHEIREFWWGVNAEVRRRDEELWARKCDFATEVVRRRLSKQFYFDELHRRAEAARKFETVTGYVEQLRGRPEAAEWLEWVEENLEDFDPWRVVSMPAPPMVDRDAHKSEIRGIAQRLSDNPDEWAEPSSF